MVSGFGQGGKFFLSECAAAANVSSLGCGGQLAAQPFGVADDSGSGSVHFTIRARARDGPSFNSTLASCRDDCVLVATVGDGYGYAYAPLAFKDGP